MGYELYLRRRAPEQQLPEVGALTESLRSAGALGAEGALSFAAGGAKVAVRLARNDGALQGVDLEVPYGAPEDDFRATVLLGTALAAKLELMLVDPQLGGELAPARADEAVASWRQASRYAAETVGIAEDVRNAAPIEPPPPLVGPRGKAMLIVLAVIVVLYLILSFVLTEMIHEPMPPID